MQVRTEGEGRAQGRTADLRPDPSGLRGRATGGEKFNDLPVAQKWIIVEAFIEEVRIMPTRRGPGFEPKDVPIVWWQAR